MKKIPLRRLLTYLVVLGLVPAFIMAVRYQQKKGEWSQVSQKIEAIHEMSEGKARKQYLNHIVRNAYSEADHFYMENQIESLCFLKKEREALEHLLKSPTFTGNEAAEKRYNLLASKANRLEFAQGNPQSGEEIQETTCSLSHPVEIDTHDLKEILNRIEGNRKGKPQLIITDLRLTRKPHATGNEVYELNFKIKKREFPS